MFTVIDLTMQGFEWNMLGSNC